MVKRYAKLHYNDVEVKIKNLTKIMNNRGKRGSLVVFDEAGFCSANLLAVGLAFITQNAGFKTSTKKNFSTDAEYISPPTQVIYASSASSTDTIFYAKYKEYAMKMFMGDSRYFCMDVPCDIVLSPHMYGEPHEPLLKKEQIDNEMRINPDKAKREYYNIFDSDGGSDQMIKGAVIVRNSTFVKPILCNENGTDKFAIAWDSARSNDGSNVGVMRICYNDEIGYYGEIVNDLNLIDLGKKKRMMMKAPDQARYVKQLLLNYNGAKSQDYENISAFLLDSGAGGGGTHYADYLLSDWKDDNGKMHKGFIDTSYHLYEEEGKNYPNASDKIKMVSPQKSRDDMCIELIELMNMDVIKFPQEYIGRGFVTEIIDDGKDEKATRTIKEIELTFEEELALLNIDAMKSEVKTIKKITSDGKTKYKLPLEKEKKGYHDDRFYVLLLLAHHLSELRRDDKLNKSRQSTIQDFSQFMIIPKGSWTD